VTQLRDPVLAPDRDHRPERDADAKGNLARLLIAVAAIVAIALLTHTTDLLIVIVALVVMIMLHELGHFVTAKWSGMKVTEYFLGFGPRLWSFRRGETEYGIKALPLGGYVKIVGMSNLEEVPPEDEPRTYRQQPFRKRLRVSVAGSPVHFILALLLIFTIFVGYGEQQPGTVQVQALTVWQGPPSPARAAGIQPGDVIVSIDGHAVSNFNQVSDITKVSAGRALVVVVKRDGQVRTLTVVPVNGHDVTEDGTPAVPASTKDAGLIGIELANPYVRDSPLVAAGHSFVGIGQLMKESVVAVWQRFSPDGIANLFNQVTNTQAAAQAAQTGARPESIYGAVRTATQGVQAGWADFLNVLVVINVFIGLLNLLPMLPLDGGHVVVAVYERIRSRRGRPYHADVAKLTPVAYSFMLLLAFVVLSAFYLDLTHPIPNPFK
jgi:membrane-associated protease RseP (regulator of RpoE activity)